MRSKTEESGVLTISMLYRDRYHSPSGTLPFEKELLVLSSDMCDWEQRSQIPRVDQQNENILHFDILGGEFELGARNMTGYSMSAPVQTGEQQRINIDWSPTAL